VIKIWALLSFPACGGSFSEDSGTIVSPYYPNNYPHNKECEYVLVNPTGGQVTIKFEDFNIEQIGDDCEYDYLEVGIIFSDALCIITIGR
jgi:cubilin